MRGGRTRRRLVEPTPSVPRNLGLVLAAATGLTAFGLLAEARAQQREDPPPRAARPPRGDPPLEPPYWSRGEARAFLASTMQLGLNDVRTQLAAGWGKPHYQWLGVEGQTRIFGGGGTEYAGVRFALPALELRTGARYTFAFDRAFLLSRDAYTADDVRTPDGPHSRYLTFEAELSAFAGIPHGVLFATASLYRISGVSDGYFVFDETMHVVVEPPWLGRIRAGHLLTFGEADALRVGIAAELLSVAARDAVVFRVGPVLAVTLTHHLDATITVMAVAASPDRLGLLGADVGQFGFRYRWATGEPSPEFP